MAETDGAAKLVANLRSAVDAIEAQAARIATLEAYRDALVARIAELETRIENQMDGAMDLIDERYALAAQIQKALDYMADTSKGDWLISYHEAVQQVRAILDAAASDILADVKADVWDECIGAFVWCLANGDLNGALQYVGEHNPYRTEQGEQADEEAVVPWADVPAANKGMIANAARRTEQGEQSNED